MGEVASTLLKCFDSAPPETKQVLDMSNTGTPGSHNSIEPPRTEENDVLNPFKEAIVYDSHKSDVVDRKFHSEQTSYWLPKDEDEQHRLTGQHFAIKELFEGNVLSKVHDVVDFKQGGNILDVGCGSGVWIMDMISDYPNCNYEGCDIVDLVYKNVGPKQVKYSFGNVVEGLPYPDNTFDFVAMRMLVVALREEEWPIAIKELLRVTKPGGVIQLIEIDLKKTGGEYVQKALEGMHMACKSRGQDPFIAVKLDDILNEAGGLKIIQSEYRSANLSGSSSLSKKFRWDWQEVFTAMISFTGPMIGYETAEKQKQFLKDLHEDLKTSNGYTYFKAVAAQKI